ncbi:MAG: MerR family transcriptional regulator [Myxococcota bacterium]
MADPTKRSQRNADTPAPPEKLYFRIGEVASMLGVDTHVVRYWESEFKLNPHRSASGQRLYRKIEVSTFMRIKHLLHEEGYTIAGARRVLNEANRPTRTIDYSQLRDLRGRLVRLRREIADFKRIVLTNPYQSKND